MLYGRLDGSRVWGRMDTCICVVGLPQWLSGKESACSAGDTGEWVQSLDREDPLEEGISIHAIILACRISWMEEPGRLRSIGIAKSDTAEATKHACMCMYGRVPLLPV